MMRKIPAFLLGILISGPAFAGSTTIGVNPGSTNLFGITTDGSGNYHSQTVICDFAACANGMTVNANGHILTELYQGASAVGATNGVYTNLLQGNAAISATNGVYSNLLQGNAVISATNGLYTNLLQGNAVIGAANGIYVLPTTAATWSVVGTASNVGSAIASGLVNINSISYLYGYNGSTWDQLQVDGSKFLKINCVTGCTSGSLSNGGSAVNPTSTNLGTVAYLYGYNSASWDQLQVDGSKFLKVNCAAGCTSGSLSNGGSGVVPTSTNLGAVSFLYGYNGASWDQIRDASNASSAMATGAFNLNTISYNYAFNGATWDQVKDASNASSAVATQAFNLNTIAYNYGYNGTTWDQLQVDGSKSLKVNCITGCTGGAVSNTTFLAPSGTNLGTISYLYGFNGTNWVQELSDGSGFIEVNTAAGGIQGFSPGTVWSGTNGVGIAAGEQHMGEVGSHGGVLTSSALGVTAVSHAAGTCLGVLVTFSNAVRNNNTALSPGTSGIIQNIVVAFASSAVPTNLDIVFFTANPGTNPCATDAATFTIATGDIGKALPAVHLSDITASGAGYLMSLNNVAMRYGLASSTTLYAAMVVRQNAVTPATGTTLNIGVFED